MTQKPVLVSSMIREYMRNYRYTSGIHGMMRSIRRLNELSDMPTAACGNAGGTELSILTFSVIPQLTRLWLNYHNGVIPDAKIYVGNCSASALLSTRKNQHVYDIYNEIHGAKIDLMVYKVITSPYILLCDDDVYITNYDIIAAALNSLRTDPSLAAVSLMPKQVPSNALPEGVATMMGSYCVIIRRDVVLENGLSFTIRPPEDDASSNWMYDTGDYLHHRLLQEGYAVDCKSYAENDHTVGFEGMSTWLLEMRYRKGDVMARVKVHPEVRSLKALLVAFAAESLSRYSDDGAMIPMASIRRSISQLTDMLSQRDVDMAKKQIEDKIRKIWPS